MSAQSHWGWRPRQTEGIWRHGCAWTKPLFAAVPWITLTLLLALFAFIGDRLPQVQGLVCDLPSPVPRDEADTATDATGLAALVLPAADAEGETLVFVTVQTLTDIDRGFPSEGISPSVRSRNEKIAAYYLSEFRDVDFPVRFDIVSLLVVAEDRALMRHYVNALGNGCC